jgi:hypothetical protein
LYPGVSELKTKWINLHDLDRAAAVRTIQKSGISIRHIAAQLDKPDSSLRRLLIMLDAPADDRFLFRRGKIAGNELVRRSKAAALKRVSQHREELEQKRERRTLKAADQISKWLLQTQLNGPNCEMIVNEVRREFAMRKQDGSLPAPTTVRLPLAEIIRRSRPPELTDDSIDIVSWFAQWLLDWSFFAFPDQDIRDNALDLALERQCKR